MFGRFGSAWRAALAIVGLGIVALVLVVPHGREAVQLFVAPAAEVGPAITPMTRTVDHTQLPVQAQADAPATAPMDTPSPEASADPTPGTAAVSGTARTSTGTGAGAGPTAARANGSQTGQVQLGTGTSTGTTSGRVLFSDNFENDPLATQVPSGWQLGDTTRSLLGGLPIIGSLVGGLSTSSLLPSAVLDGTHVLTRATGSWSHLTAGPATTDSSVSGDLKVAQPGTGFAGIAGRVVDTNNFVTCGLRNGSTLQLLQVVGGRQQVLDSRSLTLAGGAFHTIRMDLTGGVATCALDGVPLLRGTGALTGSGRVGLIALGDVVSEFDNVTMTAGLS
jgi:hypothetical protein